MGKRRRDGKKQHLEDAPDIAHEDELLVFPEPLVLKDRRTEQQVKAHARLFVLESLLQVWP